MDDMHDELEDELSEGGSHPGEGSLFSGEDPETDLNEEDDMLASDFTVKGEMDEEEPEL